MASPDFQARSRALQAVTRSLNFPGGPTVSQAQAAAGAATKAIRAGYLAAGELAGGLKARALDLPVTEARAKRDLDIVNGELTARYRQILGGADRQKLPPQLWNPLRAAIIGAYTTVFAVQAAAGIQPSLAVELTSLAQNFSEAPTVVPEAVRSLTKGVAKYAGGTVKAISASAGELAGDVGSGAFGLLWRFTARAWPLLLLAAIVLVVSGKFQARGGAFGSLRRTVGL